MFLFLQRMFGSTDFACAQFNWSDVRWPFVSVIRKINKTAPQGPQHGILRATQSRPPAGTPRATTTVFGGLKTAFGGLKMPAKPERRNPGLRPAFPRATHRRPTACIHRATHSRPTAGIHRPTQSMPWLPADCFIAYLAAAVTAAAAAAAAAYYKVAWT
jgi:hypothetical protein